MKRIHVAQGWLAGAMLLCIACSDGETTVQTTDAFDPGPAETDVGLPDSCECWPGTVLGCSDDGTGEVVCNSACSGYEVQTCGEGSLCLDDAIGCTGCVPGKLRCKNDDIIERCNDTGSEWEEHKDCNGAQTGEICQIGVCVSLCTLNSKLHSYIGCEYWGADLDNAFVPGGGEGGYYDAAGSPYAIVVSNPNPKYPATVSISTNDGVVENDLNGAPIDYSPIEPMGLRIFNLPRRDVDSTVLDALAYRVKSSIPITAYQFNPLQNENVFSNDASILLPSNALGKYYIVMTREQTFDDLKSYLTVVAVYNGETQVSVTVTAPTLGDGGIPAYKPGDAETFVMNQFDVLNIETDAPGADLTGSIVYANHPVVVFGGSEATNAPNTNHCCPNGVCEYNQIWLECEDRDDCLCEWPHNNLTPPQEVQCNTNYDCSVYITRAADHLEMQLFPVNTWGREYIASLSYPRGGERDTWRVMAAENSTKITTYPTQTNVAVLNRAEYLDFEANEPFELHAEKPVLLGQFLVAQQAPDPNVSGTGPDDAETGDPSFILTVPVEQFRDEYVFLAPDKYMFDCVNIIAPPGVPVYLDGEEIRPEELTLRPAKEIQDEMLEKNLEHPAQLGMKFGDASLIGQGNWMQYRLIIADGVHVAESTEPFGVISYGYDQYVSYGYPAGLNLEDLKLIDEESVQ